MAIEALSRCAILTERWDRTRSGDLIIKWKMSTTGGDIEDVPFSYRLNLWMAIINLPRLRCEAQSRYHHRGRIGALLEIRKSLSSVFATVHIPTYLSF